MRVVFIASDPTRDRLRGELAAGGHQILTESADAATALKLLPVLHPDVALVEITGPLAEALSWTEKATHSVPGLVICLIGPVLDTHELLAVMRAGVREYLPEAGAAAVTAALARLAAGPKPVASESAPAAALGQVAVIYSPKGGVGKSTLAANLAAAFYQATHQPGHLWDLSLQFGDLDLLLNLQPHKTMADLLPVIDDLDARTLEQTLTPSPIGVRLLAAPTALDEAEAITADHVDRAFEALRAQRGWSVVDTASHLDAVSCRAIELADVVLVPMRFDLANIRRLTRTFALWEALGIDAQKIRLVGWSEASDVTPQDVARTLGRPVAFQLPWDPATASAAINQGVPFVIGQPQTALAVALRAVAGELAGVTAPQRVKERGLANLFEKARGLFSGRKKDVLLITAGSGTPS